VPAAAALLVNVVALVVYQTAFAGRVELLEQRLAAESAQLVALRARRGELDTLRQRADIHRARVAEFYASTLQTEKQRLTRAISEVKDLARRAGLAPEAISYPSQEFDDYDLVKRGVVFNVVGSYEGLRQLINLLELSESFLTLEEIELADDSGGARLAIALRLSMLFAAEPEREAG
jgi:Tfp pilus assembly protein PilO